MYECKLIEDIRQTTAINEMPQWRQQQPGALPHGLAATPPLPLLWYFIHICSFPYVLYQLITYRYIYIYIVHTCIYTYIHIDMYTYIYIHIYI